MTCSKSGTLKLDLKAFIGDAFKGTLVSDLVTHYFTGMLFLHFFKVSWKEFATNYRKNRDQVLRLLF